MSLNGWMVTLTVVHPYYRILVNNKKRYWTIGTCNNPDESPDIYAQWEKLILKLYSVHYSIYSIFLKL